MDDEFCSCGYIKAKFDIDPEKPGLQKRIDAWTDLFSSTRRTNYYVYIQLGHESIRDNDHARGIVQQIKALGGKITRVDFSVDLASAFDFRRYYICMCCRYRHQTFDEKVGLPQEYTSPEGNTVYVGKRSSARFFRVYDKRAEIKAKKKTDIDFDLTRFEIECKRDAVPVYLALFMAGNTRAIVDDMAARYYLPAIADNPNRILPTESSQDKGSIWDFIYRYRRIIREAYYTDQTAFLDIIKER